MPVDFDALVLAPIFDTFARPVVLIAPGGAAENARGILARKPSINDMGEGAFVVHVTTLGLRASELSAIPGEGWQVIVGAEAYHIPQPAQVDAEGRVQVALQKV